MLSFFRGGGVSQVVVSGIALAIGLVFVLEFRAGRGGPTASLKKECAVEIKGSCVDPKEYFAAFGLVAPRGLSARDARQLGLHKKVQEGLVERELLAREAERLGLSVSEAEVEAELFNGRAHVSIPAADARELSYALGLCRRAEEGQGCEPGADTMVRELHVKRAADEPFDYAVYEREVRILANRGPKEFKEMQARELLAARMRDLIREPVRVSELEALAIFNQQHTTAVIRSVALARDWFAKFVVDQSDAAIDAWAVRNKAAIDGAWPTEKANFSAGCVPAREIVLEIGPGANDEDRAQTRKKLDDARERIVKGESFARVARTVSEGQTASAGGELGCVSASYGVGNEEVAKAAAALKPGELSPIVETPRGLHVLQVDAKLDSTTTEAVGRRFVARRSYVQAAADEQLKSFGEALIKRAQAGSKLEVALDAQLGALLPPPPKAARSADKKLPDDSAQSGPALAASDRPKVDISSPFSISGNPLPQLTPKEPLAARAFELKNPDDLWPSPIATADGSVVIQLKEKDLAERAEFEKNKHAIIGPRTEAKADDVLSRYIAELKKNLGDKLKLDPRFGEEPKASRNDDE